MKKIGFRYILLVSVLSIISATPLAREWNDDDRAGLKIWINAEKKFNNLKNKQLLEECLWAKITEAFAGLDEMKKKTEKLEVFLEDCLIQVEPDYYCYRENKCNEKLIRFDVDAAFGSDGWIGITENISLCACGSQIQRGFIRDIPHRYVYPPFRKEDRKLKVIGVTRNGTNEPFSLTPVTYGTEIKIGDKDVMIAGYQQYQIQYKTTRQLEFVGDSIVEFYWNVTGNYWDFAIQSASIRIKKFEDMPVMYSKFYTGKEGSTQTNAKIIEDNGYTIIRTTKELQPFEGLTVVVAYRRKDFERLFPEILAYSDWWNDYQLEWTMIALLIVAILFTLGIYYFTIRLKLKNTMMPQFEIPGDFSPAVLGYFYQKRYNERLFTASIIQLVVKKHIRIEKQKDVIKLVKLEDASTSLDLEEQKLMNALFNNTDVARIEKSYSSARLISSARWALQSAVSANYGKYLIDKKITFLKWYVAIILAGLIGVLAVNRDFIELLIGFIIVMIPIGIAVFIGVSLFIGQIQKWFFHRITDLPPTFGLMTLISTVVSMLIQLRQSSWVSPIVIFSMMATVELFLSSVMYFVKLGNGAHKVFHQTRGLVLYIKTAESKMMNAINIPEHTQENFEKYLPYAIALGLDKRWCKKYSADLKVWVEQQENIATLADWSRSRRLRTTFAAAVSYSGSYSSGSKSSSTSSYSSSSRSSGSRTSGGGGGGGGGRGW